MALISLTVLSITLCILVTPISGGRHHNSGVRSLNDLLIQSQSVKDVEDFVRNSQGQGKNWVGLNGIKVPKAKQTSEKKLRRILGTDFDPNWVSIDKPEVTTSVESSRRSEQDLIKELIAINTSAIKEDKGVVQLTPGVSKLLEKWLLQRARCDVTFIWEDLGDLFWPRWVKRGVCGSGARDTDRKYLPGFVLRNDDAMSNIEYYGTVGDDDEEDTGASCSWPPGMHCVPASSSTVQVLRWHCYPRWVRVKDDASKKRKADDKKSALKDKRRDRKRRRKMRMKCSWMKVPYPVTSECYCSC